MEPARKLRVAILFGGQSAEHEVSILSARNVLAALDRTRFEPVLIGIDRTGRWLLQSEQQLQGPADPARLAAVRAGVPVSAGPSGIAVAGTADSPAAAVDVVFPVLHGTFGEDGTVQGLFELADRPYVGAGVLASAIGMDKDVMKRLLRAGGLRTANYVAVRRGELGRERDGWSQAAARLGFPVFVKPANAGSSVGVRKVERPEALRAALEHAFEFDDKALIEEAISGREIEFAVLGGDPPQVSGAGEIVVQHRDGFYSYEAKYLDENGARLEAPARLSADELARGQALARAVFEALECEGLARVDLFLKPDGEYVVNEINTLPGFTAISMYPRLWALAGVDPTALVSRLIDLALERHRRRAVVRRRLLSP